MIPQTSGNLVRRMLLATDLTERSDRALERATQLAGEWKADLIVTHSLGTVVEKALPSANVVSWRTTGSTRDTVVRRQIEDDLRTANVPFEIIVDEGEPDLVIISAAHSRHCELIVLGITGGDTLGKLILGSTVDRVVRRATTPALIVKRRVHSRYRNVVAATDFSEGSRIAMTYASALFPEASFRALHCYNPMPQRMLDTRTAEDAGYEIASREFEQFMSSPGFSPDFKARMSVVIKGGYIPDIIESLIETTEMDLLVIGSHGHGALATMFMGNTAESLLSRVSCDILVVPQVESAAAA